MPTTQLCMDFSFMHITTIGRDKVDKMRYGVTSHGSVPRVKVDKMRYGVTWRHYNRHQQQQGLHVDRLCQKQAADGFSVALVLLSLLLLDGTAFGEAVSENVWAADTFRSLSVSCAGVAVAAAPE